MKRTTPGFTIVELLIVMAVIGILAGIIGVGWSITVPWSQNRARATEMNQWVSTFNLYKSRYAAYPAPTTTPGSYCLGGDFANNKCGNTAGSAYAPDASILSALQHVTTLPTSGQHPYVNSSYVGPFVTYSATTTIITGVFPSGYSCSSIASSATAEPTSPAGTTYCDITLP